MRQLISYLFSLLFITSSQYSLPKDTNIILTGDIMLGRSVMSTSLQGVGPNYPFIYVADKLRSADIVFSNLENAVVTNCPFIKGGFKFCADPKMVEGLKFAGVDIVSLANNHTLNFGREGLAETEKILTEQGIKWVGEGNLEIIEKNGTKFGFLGFDYVDYLPKDADFKLIMDSKTKVDVLIVMIHWGVEYTSEPTAKQKMVAKDIIAAGADFLVGAHPHWVQSNELIDGKPVYYSLGNFIFDQSWSEATKKGLALEVLYKSKDVQSVQKMPVYMKDIAQPKWVD